MSGPEIYKGRGNAAMYDDFLDFINYVFGFNGNSEDFPKLLPKLYKPQYLPCENNYVVTEDGKLKAAIGVFPRELDVMGVRLKTHGVGNVAVHPYSRSKGYMKELLHTAVDDMIASGADMSDLGGLRQRYGYFSYEVASPVYHFSITGTSIRHSFAGIPERPFEFREIGEGDPLLDEIIALHEKRSCRTVRPREAFLDITRSWSCKLYAALEAGRFRGCFIGKLGELTLCDVSDAGDVIRDYVTRHGDVTLNVPAYATALIAAAERICDDVKLANDQNYTIFRFKRVIEAFIKLKAASAGLVDGSLSFRINGVAGAETIRISVNGGAPEVTEVSGAADITLEHIDAVSYFFGLSSSLRAANPLAAAWFPLPLHIDSADHV